MWPTLVHEVAGRSSVVAVCRACARITCAARPGTVVFAGTVFAGAVWAGTADWAEPLGGTAVLANAPAAAAAVTEITSTDGTPMAIARRFRRRGRVFVILARRSARRTRSEGMKYLRSGEVTRHRRRELAALVAVKHARAGLWSARWPGAGPVCRRPRRAPSRGVRLR